MTNFAAAPRRNWWTIGLWVAQALLAFFYAFAGFTKLFTPIPDLVPMMAWAPTLPEWLVRFIGLAEIAGALGLILPALTRILPWLTPLAAICLSIIQILAIGLHAMRGETAMTLPMNIVLLALSLF